MSKPAEALAALVLGVPAAAWDGLVVQVLWGWFVVPLGLPAIGIAQAFGLRLLAALPLIGVYRRSEDSNVLVDMFARAAVMAIVLGTAYLTHRCMT